MYTEFILSAVRDVGACYGSAGNFSALLISNSLTYEPASQLTISIVLPVVDRHVDRGIGAYSRSIVRPVKAAQLAASADGEDRLRARKELRARRSNRPPTK